MCFQTGPSRAVAPVARRVDNSKLTDHAGLGETMTRIFLLVYIMTKITSCLLTGEVFRYLNNILEQPRSIRKLRSYGCCVRQSHEHSFMTGPPIISASSQTCSRSEARLRPPCKMMADLAKWVRGLHACIKANERYLRYVSNTDVHGG